MATCIPVSVNPDIVKNSPVLSFTSEPENHVHLGLHSAGAFQGRRLCTILGSSKSALFVAFNNQVRNRRNPGCSQWPPELS